LTHDLILKNGRVIDPASGLDRVVDIAFAGGKVAGIGDQLGEASETRDVTSLIVAPGLIDLHTHVYWGGTSLGIDADEFCRRDGVTTCVDTGSAGPGNFAGFRTHVIDRATPRILAFLNISYAGIFGFSRSIMVGEAQDMRLLAPQDCAEIADANRDVIVAHWPQRRRRFRYRAA
jgi:dihydroorotase